VTDLPEPLSPTMPSASPRWIAKSTPRTAGAPSKATRSPSILINGPAMAQIAKLPGPKSMAKAGAAFHWIDFGLAVKVAFWCSTV